MFYCIWIREDPGGTGHDCAELENRGNAGQEQGWAGAQETPAVGRECVRQVRRSKYPLPLLLRRK